MTLTETKTVDQITVTENGTVLVREATRILKDGLQIAAIARHHDNNSRTPSVHRNTT